MPRPRLPLLLFALLLLAPAVPPVRAQPAPAPAPQSPAPQSPAPQSPAQQSPTQQAPAETPAEPTTPAEPPVQVFGLRVEIVERGLYQTTTGTIRQMPNGIGENLVEAVELERSTTHIPARPGVSFGLEFIVHGRPAGTLLELTTTVVFPPPGLHPPGQPAPVASSTTPMVVEVGADTAIYRGYTFDYDWEVAPGPWRFEIRLGDRLLAVQSFTITNES